MDLSNIEQELKVMQRELNVYRQEAWKDKQIDQTEQDQINKMEADIERALQALTTQQQSKSLFSPPEDNPTPRTSTGGSSRSGNQGNIAPSSGGSSFTRHFYDGKEGVSYKISLLVDQPGTGGDRDTWELQGLGADVGHVYLEFVKRNTDGSSPRAWIGFYPVNSVGPNNPESPGEIRNDGGSNADVEASTEVTHRQFFNALHFIDQFNASTYHLSAHNCTTFAIIIARAAGWNVTTQRGTWPGGGGLNPGDLGEDLVERYNGRRINGSGVSNHK